MDPYLVMWYEGSPKNNFKITLSMYLSKVGNMMNQLIFGMRYSREDELWQRLQQLRDEGIKMIGVCGIVNFLPFVR